jgi:hypothetical protein
VWSLAVRRKAPRGSAAERELAELIKEGRVAMLGPIRQELLSGVKQPRDFDVLRDHLRAFPDEALGTTDYEEAALCFNRCRAKGIQGSNTDFLLCAVSARRKMLIFTTDRDFGRYAEILPIQLHRPTS